MKKWFMDNIKGLILASAVTVAALILGHILPIIGAAVFGIVIGIIVNNTVKAPASCAKGLEYAAKKNLKIAIVLVGAGLSFTQVLQTGADTFVLMIFTLSASFIAAFAVGKLLGVSSPLKSLIGVGTAICGGSAIAAIAPIIEAEDKDISYSISTVFLFNIAAVFIFPPLGHMFGLSDNGFGLWAGTAINDTSSVVAAGYTYSTAAGDFATIVKLTRTTMIVPIAVIFAAAIAHRKRKSASSGVTHFSFIKVFPWFVLGFCAMSIVNSSALIPPQIMTVIKEAGKILIVVSLSAIGLKTDFRKMISAGWKPMALGLITWFAVAVSGLAVQHFSGRW